MFLTFEKSALFIALEFGINYIHHIAQFPVVIFKNFLGGAHRDPSPDPSPASLASPLVRASPSNLGHSAHALWNSLKNSGFALEFVPPTRQPIAGMSPLAFLSSCAPGPDYIGGISSAEADLP